MKVLSRFFACRLAGIAAAVFLITACERPKVVEPLKKPAVNVTSRKSHQKPRRGTASSRHYAGTARTETSYSESPPAVETTATAAATPDTTTPAIVFGWIPPTPSPTPEEHWPPVVVSAQEMHTDRPGISAPDSEGGVVLNQAGGLILDNFKLDHVAREVVVEMRGEAAGNVWPEVDVNLYNRTEQKAYFAWPRDFVTSPRYHGYRHTLDVPLPPGEYFITFRYYNNVVPDGVEGDRNVYLRKITFNP